MDYSVEELKVLLVALWMEDCDETQVEQIRKIFRELNPDYDGTF